MPKGFESFSDAKGPVVFGLPASSLDQGLLQPLIELNKACISLIDGVLDQTIGDPAGCAGLSIFIWAAFIKVLTTPIYERTIKLPL